MDKVKLGEMLKEINRMLGEEDAPAAVKKEEPKKENPADALVDKASEVGKHLTDALMALEKLIELVKTQNFGKEVVDKLKDDLNLIYSINDDVKSKIVTFKDSKTDEKETAIAAAS